LKTQENLDVVRAVPLDRIMLETGEWHEPLADVCDPLTISPDLLDTDAPWCSITTTAASHAYLPKDGPFVAVEKTKTLKPGGQTGVKGRNEPADVSVDRIVAATSPRGYREG
jgi:TatD DNase family protein